MGLISFFSSALKLFLRVVLILLLLSALGVNMASVMTAIGASLVTMGLVLKDPLANFVSGLLLIVNKPIRVGDYIEFENIKGTVTRIEMIFTTLNSSDGHSIIIPNSRLVSNNIVRESPYDVCEYSFDILAVGNKPNVNLKKILEILFISDERILQIPPPNVEYNVMNHNEFNIKITLFCQKRYVEILDKETPNKVKTVLKKHGIKVEANKDYTI